MIASTAFALLTDDIIVANRCLDFNQNVTLLLRIEAVDKMDPSED
jgi:hypothetical protein